MTYSRIAAFEADAMAGALVVADSVANGGSDPRSMRLDWSDESTVAAANADAVDARSSAFLAAAFLGAA